MTGSPPPPRPARYPAAVTDPVDLSLRAVEGVGEQVRWLSDLLPDGLLTIDDNRVVVFANSRAGEILGIDQRALIGRPLVQALPLTDADGRSWWEVSSPWVGLHTRKGHREKLLWTESGVEVLATARYVRLVRRGPVVRVLIALRDAQARQRVEQDHAALLSTLAHELRSPLTSVKGFSATLLRRWDRFTDEQKRIIIETIEVDADRISRLVADLLDVSRIDSGRLQVRPQLVDLEEIVQRHLSRLHNQGVPADRVAVAVSHPLPVTWADPDRLDQILINLLDNALKHGGGTVRVTVRQGSTDLLDGAAGDGRPAVVVSVSDQGGGIPERLRSVIFGRFWHAPGHGNTGLGLYVVKALVEAHGGRITAGDAPGGGAQFRFSLPIGEPEHLVRDSAAAAGH